MDRLRFGVIQLTVHDGKLVQLEITEKRRFS
ncbi:MAG: YezD family protein [Pseudomonadota bacterium]|nr:YezD family protein [Pseudomonadota bacterium]